MDVGAHEFADHLRGGAILLTAGGQELLAKLALNANARTRLLHVGSVAGGYTSGHSGSSSGTSLAKAELEAGVIGLFKRDDTDGDGFLNAAEVRAVNDRLVAETGPGATPVIDWNADGRVNAQEYGAQWRTLFDRSDVNGDGVIDPRERAGRVKPRKARPLPEPSFGGYRGPQG